MISIENQSWDTRLSKSMEIDENRPFEAASKLQAAESPSKVPASMPPGLRPRCIESSSHPVLEFWGSEIPRAIDYPFRIYELTSIVNNYSRCDIAIHNNTSIRRWPECSAALGSFQLNQVTYRSMCALSRSNLGINLPAFMLHL